MSMDRIRARLAKLLAVAGDAAATPGEVENALKLARAIMAEHHLSAEQVTAEEPMECAGVSLDRQVMPGWVKLLASFVAKLVGGVDPMMVRMFPGPRPCVAVEFAGRASDVKLAAHIFRTLQAAIQAASVSRGYGSVWAGRGRAYGYGFVLGLAKGLMKAKVGESNALVLVESRKTAEARAFALATAGGNLPDATRATKPTDKGAMAVGFADGVAHHVDVSKPPAGMLVGGGGV
jgi:hypothetical protein